MKNTFLSLIGFFALTLVVAGCASAPNEALESAQQSLAAADSVEADLYVADQYGAAFDSLEAAKIAIAAEDAKSSFSRDYSHAEQLLQFASTTAQEAAANVEVKKEEMRVSNEALLAEAEAAVAQVQTLLAQAPRGKDGAVALVAIQEDSGNATTTLEQAVAAQENGEYAQAHDLAQAALDKANALVAELSTAIQKTQPLPRS